MHIQWNEKYTTIALYAFLVLCGGLVAALLLWNLPGLLAALGGLLVILRPFIWGVAIAYVLSRPARFFEERLFGALLRRGRRSLARGLAVSLALLLLLAVLGALLGVLLPQLAGSVLRFAEQLPQYARSLSAWAGGLLSRVGFSAENALSDWALAQQDALRRGLLALQDSLPSLALDAFNFIGSAALALVFAVYLLASREKFIMQLKKLCFALFPKKFTERTIRICRESHGIFSRFLSGKIFEALLLGVLTFLGMSVMGLSYPLLVGMLMAIANLVPVIGPVIGAIPSALILLLADPRQVPWFLALVLVLQGIDGQWLGPKILGGSTGLTAFWVIFAIVLGGGLFGVLGTILGVPVFALFYSLVRSFADARLAKKGLSARAEDYHSSAAPRPK